MLFKQMSGVANHIVCLAHIKAQHRSARTQIDLLEIDIKNSKVVHYLKTIKSAPSQPL